LKPDVSIVIPAYNEEKTIYNLIKGIHETFNSGYAEIIVVDDGSTDNTTKLAAKIPGIKVLKNDRNLGYGGAILTGIFEAKGDIIVTIDGDAQNKPKEINLLIQPILKNDYDFVVGARHKGMTFSPIPIFKRVAETVVRFVLKFMYGIDISYSQSGFRAMKRKVLRRIMPLYEYKFAFSMELLMKTVKNGFRIKEVPITFMARPHGCSRVNVFRDGLRIIYVMIKHILMKEK